MPHAQSPILGVAWTLEREALFYLLFGAAILDRRLGAAVAAAWLGLSLAGVDLGRWTFDEYSGLFLFGIAAAAVSGEPLGSTPSAIVRRPLLLAALGAAAFLAAGMSENAGLLAVDGWLPRLAYGSASAALIVGLAAGERAGLIRIGRTLPRKSLRDFSRLLGAASYAIYLVHNLVLGLAARALAEAGLLRFLPDGLAMAGCCGAAVAAGLVFHRQVEVRLTALVRRARRDPINPLGRAGTLTKDMS